MSSLRLGTALKFGVYAGLIKIGLDVIMGKDDLFRYVKGVSAGKFRLPMPMMTSFYEGFVLGGTISLAGDLSGWSSVSTAGMPFPNLGF